MTDLSYNPDSVIKTITQKQKLEQLLQSISKADRPTNLLKNLAAIELQLVEP